MKKENVSGGKYCRKRENNGNAERDMKFFSESGKHKSHLNKL